MATATRRAAATEESWDVLRAKGFRRKGVGVRRNPEASKSSQVSDAAGALIRNGNGRTFRLWWASARRWCQKRKPQTKGNKMIVKLRITKEDVNEYDGRKGHVVQKILICQDEAPKGMRNTIDVVVDKDDEIKLGKVPHVGKLLEFNVRDIFPVFGGRVKFSGAV